MAYGPHNYKELARVNIDQAREIERLRGEVERLRAELAARTVAEVNSIEIFGSREDAVEAMLGQVVEFSAAMPAEIDDEAGAEDPARNE